MQSSVKNPYYQLFQTRFPVEFFLCGLHSMGTSSSAPSAHMPHCKLYIEDSLLRVLSFCHLGFDVIFADGGSIGHIYAAPDKILPSPLRGICPQSIAPLPEFRRPIFKMAYIRK